MDVVPENLTDGHCVRWDQRCPDSGGHFEMRDLLAIKIIR